MKVPIIRRASLADSAALVRLVCDFHVEDGHPLDDQGIAALTAMLEPDSECGRVYVVEAAGVIVGYAVLCFGYTVEHGGRDAFLDDIYIAPSARRQGYGSRLYAELESDAVACRCRALHLELMPKNPMMRWYRALGYIDRGSVMLTKRMSINARSASSE
jgi:ribosomal protein S18 acetylase RimI-like enzyme